MNGKGKPDRERDDDRRTVPAAEAVVGSVVALKTGARVNVMVVLRVDPDFANGSLHVVSDDLKDLILPVECFR